MYTLPTNQHVFPDLKIRERVRHIRKRMLLTPVDSYSPVIAA